MKNIRCWYLLCNVLFETLNIYIIQEIKDKTPSFDKMKNKELSRIVLKNNQACDDKVKRSTNSLIHWGEVTQIYVSKLVIIG